MNFLLPLPPELAQRHTGQLRKRDNMLTGEGVGREEANHSEKVVLFK
jgi:hypothetical protein